MLKFLLIILTVLYPGLVYLGLAHFRPGNFGMLIAVLVLLRLGILSDGERRWMPVPFLLLIGYAVVVAWSDSEILVRIYPALVNAIMLGAFGWSLLNPPSLIERISRARGMPISPAGVSYTRNLTGVWCGFFALNGAAAAYTAIASSLAIWALYNGLIAYLAMGLLIVVEMLYRRRYKRRHANNGTAAQ